MSADRYAVGTRAVVKDPERPGWRVVCAACDAGGTVRHDTRDAAMTAAVRDSAKPCNECGAR